jgi:hypothetical protein
MLTGVTRSVKGNGDVDRVLGGSLLCLYPSAQGQHAAAGATLGNVGATCGSFVSQGALEDSRPWAEESNPFGVQTENTQTPFGTAQWFARYLRRSIAFASGLFVICSFWGSNSIVFRNRPLMFAR